MKLACSSLFLPDVRYGQKLERALRLGYEGIEIRLEENPDLDRQVAEIEAALSEHPIKACSVIVRSPAYRAPLASEEVKIAKLASARIAIQIASKLNAPVILQPEYGPQIPLPLFDELKQLTAEERDLLYRFLSEAAELAEKETAIVLIEPINRYETHYYHRLEEAIALCEHVGSRRIKICADFFHMNIEEQDVVRSIEYARGYIYHVQLADSNRRLPGEGHLDFTAYFSALRRIDYDRYMALECMRPRDPDSELLRCSTYLQKCLTGSQIPV
jgi:sugar phosphate isomerase/epimerase